MSTIVVSGSTPAEVSVTIPQVNSISVTPPEVRSVSVSANVPSNARLIPAGGAEGVILRKDSVADYDVEWTPYSFPAADGDDYQVLVTDGAGALTFDHVRSIRITIRNDEGATIPAGTPVYSKGEVGGSERILVGIADASDPAKMPAIGIAETTLTTTGDTKDGYAIMSGVFNTNVSGFTGLSEGDILYVSNSGGGLSQTKPTGTYLIQNVGIVLKTNGTIMQGFQVSCIGRTNDIPNIATGNIWAGNADGVATATSVAYIDIANERVGIGTTSPSDKLHVSDLQPATIVWAKIENTSLVGAAGAGVSYKTPNRTWQTVGRETGYSIENTTAGSTPFTISSSGKVGIGTTTPSVNLELGTDGTADQQLRLNSDVAGAYLRLESLGNVARMRATNGANLTIQSDGGSGYITNWAGGSERMRINYNGNVGIGTTGPAKKLHVLNSTNEAQIRLGQSGSGSYDIGVYSGDTFSIGRDADTREFTLSGGNVGIGVTSPAEKLEVLGNIRLNTVGNQLEFSNANVALQRGASNVLELGGYGGIALKASAAAIDSQTERMRITDAGNVGIGTTSPAQKLEVSFAASTYGARFTRNDAAGSSLIEFANSAGVKNVTGYNAGVDGYTIGTSADTHLTVRSTGNVGIGTTSPTTPLHVAGVTQIAESGNTAFYGGNYVRLFNDQNFNIRDVGGSTVAKISVSGDSYFNGGNVGIGTTSPSAKLDVVGLANINDGSNNVLITTNNAALTTGSSNAAVGYNTLKSVTSGSYNSAFGSNALESNLTGVSNSAFGTEALRYNTGANNTAFGTGSLRSKTSGDNNSAFGVNALYNNLTGNSNIAIGRNAGYYTTGSNNALIGYYAGYGGATSTFSNTVALGYQSLYSLTTGVNNTAVGYQAATNITTGGYNTALGYGALDGAAPADKASNTGLGYNALGGNTTGSYNVAVGAGTGQGTVGWSNTIMGVNAANTTTGSNSVIIGFEAARFSSGSNNVAIGYEAAEGVSGSSFSNTVAVGYEALTALTSGATNTAVGYKAGTNINIGSGNTAIGYEANHNGTSTDGNTAVGKSTLYNTTGSLNVAIGGGAAYGGGGASFSNTVAVGYQALYDLTSGAGNTAVGYQASTNINSGANNTTVGYQAGYTNTTGIRNIFIGYQAGYNETGSDKLYINNSSGSNPLIYGDFNLRAATINGDLNVSSGNLKADAIEISGRSQTSPAAGEYGAGSKIVTQFATGTVTAGVVYVASSGAWVQGDADVGSASIGMIAVATDSASANSMLIEGVIKLSSNAGFSGASAGDVLYLSNTAGELTTTAPSGTGDYVRVCGYVVNALQHEVFFSPSKEWRVV